MFQTTIRRLLAITLLGAQVLLAQSCYAENTDRDQPIKLEADHVLIDDAKQTSTFTGNVQLSQGTLRIRGEKVIVKQDKEGFRQVITSGETANFRQKQEGTEGYIQGYGKHIEYNTLTEVLDIYGQARLKRGLNEVSGEHITYNTKTEIFVVSGSGISNDNQSSNRVRAVIQPKSAGSSSAPLVDTPHQN